MTVLAERQPVTQTACYEVRCPDTGELLGRVTTPAGSASTLLQALERNGLALIEAGRAFGERLRAGVAA